MLRSNIMTVLACGLLWLLLAALLIAPVGCNELDIEAMKAEVSELRKDAAAGREALELSREQRAELAEAIAALPEGKTKDALVQVLNGLDVRIEQISGVLLNADEALGDYEMRLANARDGLDVAEATVQSTATFLPPPWNAMLAAGGGLILGLLRAAQNRKHGRAIAGSVDGRLTELDPAAAAAISAAQGAGAKRIVDEAQGKKLKLPF